MKNKDRPRKLKSRNFFIGAIGTQVPISVYYNICQILQ
jgi:hypothetical protein